ncbi:GPI-inositol-deacylase [Lenzites betulinus]|nr:GPI-inositol-deacylase [Lenzites betulinus]
MARLLALLAAAALAAVATLYYAGVVTYYTLSPQGCRMSWMWPSYVLQSHFDRSWTPLARRYSLWLYREGNLENNELHGAPVLFIPGNAGSSHQVRSIASSAANQYFSAPYQVAPEFANGAYKGLDFFAVEYNEDLSAFHGPTIDSQTAYAQRAIDYILSQYAPGTSIIVMAHSMGGVVATALLPNPNISAIITMSTPHTLPPVRFDRRIDHIYADNFHDLGSDPTPLLSLCGGATDLMIPSESCILPALPENSKTSIYRRTVFTSALEGCWTGVGHLAMVWCHQVRWRVARAALEIAALPSPETRAVALDRWLRDGHTLPPDHLPSDSLELRPGEYYTVPLHQHLLVRNPRNTRSYLLPVPLPDLEEGLTSAKFVLYASQGSVPPISPHRPLPFRVTVYLCPDSDTTCSPLAPETLKLIPSPLIGAPFPVPDEGSDESEGAVLFEAEVPLIARSHVAVKIDSGDGRGWVFGGFADSEPVVAEFGLAQVLLSSIRIRMPNGVRTEVQLPTLPASALLVYRLTPRYDPDSLCSVDTLLLPLLTHTSHPSETHYHPLAPTFPRRVLLHTHASAPYIASEYREGHKLVIHSSGECWVNEIQISVDWWASIGRWGTRYGTAAACWAVGIMSIVLWDVWKLVENEAPFPAVGAALEFFARRRLPWLTLVSYLVSLLPLRVGLWLGNNGNAAFAPLAIILLPIAFGLVVIVWWVLRVSMWPLQWAIARGTRRREDAVSRRPMATLISMGVVFLVIFVLVPWQVAFVGCWSIHFYTCAASLARLSLAQEQQPSPTEAIPLVSLSSTLAEDEDSPASERVMDEHRPLPSTACISLAQQANAHLLVLLFMTWLLPLVAPVLAVWVRTLATAGFTTPFDGDHNFLYVAPFLVLVETWSGGDADRYVHALFEKKGRVSPRWGFLALAGVAFFLGPRTTYFVFEAASAALGWAVVSRLGPFYWGGRPFWRQS